MVGVRERARGEVGRARKTQTAALPYRSLTLSLSSPPPPPTACLWEGVASESGPRYGAVLWVPGTWCAACSGVW